MREVEPGKLTILTSVVIKICTIYFNSNTVDFINSMVIHIKHV